MLVPLKSLYSFFGAHFFLCQSVCVVKIAARVLKIGVHLRFDPNFTVEFEHFYQKYFRQAYCTPEKHK